MASGFQKDDDAEPVTTLPTSQQGSDHPAKEHNWIAAEFRHSRFGIVIGNRSFKNVRRWRMVFDRLDGATVSSTFLIYFRESLFRFIPDTGTPGTYHKVTWRARRWRPEPVGRFTATTPTEIFYRLEFEIEEAL